MPQSLGQSDPGQRPRMTGMSREHSGPAVPAGSRPDGPTQSISPLCCARITRDPSSETRNEFVQHSCFDGHSRCCDRKSIQTRFDSFKRRQSFPPHSALATRPRAIFTFTNRLESSILVLSYAFVKCVKFRIAFWLSGVTDSHWLTLAHTGSHGQSAR